ncbi:MAG: hypothetical protein MK212_12375 [Saprospiraceae bacterium]|nr:hypothetical protein [Saprospiraceae bacterium]
MTKEKLLVINRLVQNLPYEQRLTYLKSLELEANEDFLQSDAYYVDNRDYNIYSILRVGDLEWLGENLRYKTEGAYFNPKHPNLFYGALYNWSTLMNVDSRYNKKLVKDIGTVYQGICPEGWYLPSLHNWLNVLGKSFEETRVDASNYREVLKKHEATRFKSSIGWGNDRLLDSNSLDVYPSGSQYHQGSFFQLGNGANFWTIDQGGWTLAAYDPSWAVHLQFYLSGAVSLGQRNKQDRCSCRCYR